MSIYGTIDGVKKSYPKIAEKIVPDQGADPTFDILESNVQKVIEYYSGQVDAALAKFYPVPFAVPPQIVVEIVNDLAACKIARQYLASVGEEENKNLAALRRDALDTLDKIAKGTYEIPGLKRQEASLESALEEILEQSDEVFTFEDEAAWQTKL